MGIRLRSRLLITAFGLLGVIVLALACAKGDEKGAAPAPASPAVPVAPAAPTPVTTPAPAVPAPSRPAPTAAPAPAAPTAAAARPASLTGAAEPLPPRPALARPAAPGPGAIQFGLEGYDLSKPYVNEFQAKEKAAQLLLEYSGDKLPLWTRATYGGELRILGAVTPTSFWPFGQSDGGGYMHAGYGLRMDMGRCSLQGKTDMTKCDGKRGEVYSAVLVPDVFNRWEQPDPLTYIFHLRKGVLWPAIPPMTRVDREVISEDIIWYYQAQGQQGLLRGLFELTDTWQAVDRYTVKVTMKAPHSDFIRGLSNRGLRMIPRECAQKAVCADKNILISPGPFIITEVVPRQKTVWKRNSEYHVSGAPWVDGVLSVSITDPAAQKSAFLTGQTDSYGVESQSELTGLLKQRPDIQVQAMAATSTVANFRPKLEGPLADLLVRRALTMSVDWRATWEVCCDGYMFGGVIIPYDYLGLTMPLSLIEMGANYRFDPQEARKLLAQAGFSNGFSMTLNTYTSSGQLHDLLVALQQYWKRNLNVEVKIVTRDSASHQTLLLEKNWQGLWFNQNPVIGGAVFEADSIMLQLASGSAQNLQGVNDPVLNDLFRRQRSELDPGKRRDLLWQFYQRNQDMLWMMQLGQRLTRITMQPWELNAANHIYAYVTGINGSTWTHMLDTSRVPKR